jgi:putative flippase GtrA
VVLRTLSRYFTASVIGTALNFASRFLFELFMPFLYSVAAATYVGMVVIFVLSYKRIFATTLSWKTAFLRFAITAHVGLAVVMGCSEFALWALDPFVSDQLPQSLINGAAHAFGIGVGFVFNFLGHLFFSFARLGTNALRGGDA